MRYDIEFEFALHGRKCFTAVPMLLPNDPALRYEIIGEVPEGGLDVEAFKAALAGKRFPRAAAFEFHVIVGGVRRRVKVPLPEWPSGEDVVREAKILTKLII